MKSSDLSQNVKTGDIVSGPTWDAIGAELSKGEQMGYQIVAQFAKVGQMLIEKMGDTPIREFVQRAGQHVPHLTRSTCHNYMMLAKHIALLEQHKPDSQRAALALIAASNAEPKVIPAPTPVTPRATPQQQPEAPPVTSEESAEERNRKAEEELNAIPDQFNLSEPMKVRYAKAIERAIKVATKELNAKFLDEVVKGINERLPDRITHGEERIAKWEASHVQRDAVLREREASADHILTEEEFKIIRGCLHSDRVPDELKARFDRALAAINKLAPWFSHNAAEKKAAEKSEQFRRQWNAEQYRRTHA